MTERVDDLIRKAEMLLADKPREMSNRQFVEYLAGRVAEGAEYGAALCAFVLRGLSVSMVVPKEMAASKLDTAIALVEQLARGERGR